MEPPIEYSGISILKYIFIFKFLINWTQSSLENSEKKIIANLSVSSQKIDVLLLVSTSGGDTIS